MQALGGRAAGHKLSPLVVANDSEYIGDAEAFYTWAVATLRTKSKPFNPILFNQMAKTEYRKYLESNPHPHAYMDVAIGEEPPIRVVYELFADKCPRTGGSPHAAFPCCVVAGVHRIGPLSPLLQLRTSCVCALGRRARHRLARNSTTKAHRSIAPSRAAGCRVVVRCRPALSPHVVKVGIVVPVWMCDGCRH